MPELGYKPVNKYLPPRPRRPADGREESGPLTAVLKEGASVAERLFAWADRVLSR